MEEQTQAITVRTYRNLAAIEELVAEYEASGLTGTEFCRRRGLNRSTFQRYLRRWRQRKKGEPGVNLVAVELCGTRPVRGQGQDSGLAVALSGGRRIAVARDFDAGTLVQLVGLLERF